MCNKCCHKDPKKRPQSIQDFQKELSDALEHWDAMQLIQKARAYLEELKNTDNVKKSYPIFIKSRILFEHALLSWPESITAQRGVIKSIFLMLHKLLAEKEVGTASTLLTELSSIVPNHPDLPSLREKINTLEKQQMLFQV